MQISKFLKSLKKIDHHNYYDIEANFEKPCEAGGIGTIVPGLFKA